MRRFIFCFLAIVAFSVSTASAQQKGDMSLSSHWGLGVSSAVIEGSSATGVEFNIGVEAGVFVADNFRLGVGLGYGVEGGGGDATHTFNIGPSLSYYVAIGNKLYYAPKLDLAFCLGAYDSESIPGFGLGLSIANFEYRPTESIGLSASVLSLNYVLLSKHGLTLNNVDLSLSLSPKLGLSYYF